ncbi:unnamed protein product, partial [Mesorhabditis belari]|uniref:Uncharacterized protein n=1 Tax=Mesorhabditis belari TaxID=2138241 RepID=A0AAF3FJU5_9BILA
MIFSLNDQVSFSLDCFHCKDCDRETALVKECHSSTSQCYSILGPITRRGCAHKCPYNSAISEEECHLCSDDLCNHHQQDFKVTFCGNPSIIGEIDIVEVRI